MGDYIYVVALILAGVLGLCVGSFLNVVIYRLPNGMNLAKPASHCPKCKNEIKWYDNIPVLSYIILRGKCRHCKTHITFRYTLVELLNACLWVASVALFWPDGLYAGGNVAYAILSCIVCSVLICMFFIDLEHMIIPDSLQLVLLGCAIGMIFCDWDYDNTWLVKLFGLFCCAGFFFIVHYASLIIFKKEALGGGDVKLFSILGLLLGFTNAILTIIIACITASIVLLSVKNAKNHKKNKEYPFAPFIVIGAIISLFFGYYIVQGYLELIA